MALIIFPFRKGPKAAGAFGNLRENKRGGEE